MDNINQIEEFFGKLNKQFEDSYNEAWTGDTFDNEYFAEKAPSMVIDDPDGDIEASAILEDIRYDAKKDEVTLVEYPNGRHIVIQDFSKSSVEFVGANMVIKNAACDIYATDVKTPSIYYSVQNPYTVTLYRM